MYKLLKNINCHRSFFLIILVEEKEEANLIYCKVQSTYFISF